ncbi:hypothetical protein OG440_40140 (plasmid) [Streptomyces sp. NBC_00637]|uniref:hypothetical protein n=1 Tax=Streptomyces sp. NBC_00637 TaxID=2903667 RepID=UPI003244A318
MSMKPATAWVEFGTRERMTKALDRQKRHRIMLSSESRWRAQGLPRDQALDVRQRWREHVDRLREAGELLDVVDVLAAYGIRHELARRGWNRDWPEVPMEARISNRWPGSHDGGYPESIPLRLPGDLADRVLCACWHTSSEAIRGIRDWSVELGIPVPRRPPSAVGEDALAEYERLAAQVTTVGDIYRAGLNHGIGTAESLSQRGKGLPELDEVAVQDGN